VQVSGCSLAERVIILPLVGPQLESYKKECFLPMVRNKRSSRQLVVVSVLNPLFLFEPSKEHALQVTGFNTPIAG
jgi:hypothetical protein